MAEPLQIDRRTFIIGGGLGLLAACAAGIGLSTLADRLGSQSAARLSVPTPTSVPPNPTGIPLPPNTLAPTQTMAPLPTPGATAIATATRQPMSDLERNRLEWTALWPNNAKSAALMFGGEENIWERNSEWPDSKIITRVDLGVSEYKNKEWRVKPGSNLPFTWPKTAKEAAGYFFPGQNIDPRFIQPSWTDQRTKVITGWHLSEDLWIVDGKPADREIDVHSGEVCEGYTVMGDEKPENDRHYVIWVKPSEQSKSAVVDIAKVRTSKMQGLTIWLPGTDPNAIALRMKPWPANTSEYPYYTGKNGEQLGPDAHGFTPVYPAANLYKR